MSMVEHFMAYLSALATYFSVMLMRSAVLSVPVALAVFAIRRMLHRDAVFVRGLLWSVFLLVPFTGKLRAYYETAAWLRAFWRIQDLCFTRRWVRSGYMIFVVAGCLILCVRQVRMQRSLERLRTETVCAQHVRISESVVSPFAAGLLRPQIMLPRVMLEQLDETELRGILLHERTHIRLGHLWIFFLWDVFCCLLWINPLLWCGRRMLKEDMEHICDCVTIRDSAYPAQEYGRLILKSIGLLRDAKYVGAAAFSGERGFDEIRRRIGCVSGYQRYDRRKVRLLCAVVLVAVLLTGIGIKQLSYPSYTRLSDVTVCEPDGANVAFVEGDEKLLGAFSYDGRYVTIDVPAFAEVLAAHDIQWREFWLYFDGYMKFPGIGGGGSMVYVDLNGTQEILHVPYERSRDLMDDIFRML